MTLTTAEIEKEGITSTLAAYMVGLDYGDLPTEVVESAKLYSLETLSYMLSGQAQPVSKIVVEYLRGIGANPQAIVVGAGMRSSLAEAAYANGTFAHADELESHGTFPGTGLLPPVAAAITVGDYVDGTSGRDFITAVVAGIEMQGRIGMAGIGACDRGFMGISLVGPAAAAVSAGRLLGLDIDQMRHCLGIAMPLGNGSLRGCGYMSHVHEAGVPTRTGVFAAQMAARGFTGCIDYLDGANSWGDQFAGGSKRPYDPDPLTADLGHKFFLQESDVAPKQYGSCGLTHLSMQGAIDLMLEHELQPEDILSAEMLVPPWAERVAAFREPKNGEQAKFSLRQGLAAILVDGVPTFPFLRPFSDDTCNDPRYVAARDRVVVKVEEGGLNQRGFASQAVTLHLRDGRSVTKKVEHSKIRGHVDNPYTLEERIGMVRNLLASCVASDRVDQIVEVVLDLEHHDVAEVSKLIATTNT